MTEPLYAQLEGKGDTIYEVLGFVGGDWQHYAIVENGRRVKAVPLEDLRMLTPAEAQHELAMQDMGEAGY